MKFRNVLIAACCIVVSAATAPAQVVVIANKSVSAASIDKETLRNLYTLDSKNLGSTKVVLFDVREEGTTKASFYRYLGLTSDAAKKLWLRAKLTGAGDPPSAGSEDEIIQKVANTPGAIGYVSASNPGSQVKVLLHID